MITNDGSTLTDFSGSPDVAYLRGAFAPYDPADTGDAPLASAGSFAPRRRPRTVMLIAATVTAVAVSVGVPYLVLSHGNSSEQASAASSSPISPADCLHHNSAAGQPTQSSPVVQTTTRATKPDTTRWYSPAKASQLTATLKAGLPAGSCVFTGSSWGELSFPEQLQPGIERAASAVGVLDAQANGRLVTSAGDGTLMVSIRRATNAGDCIAGAFDKRFTSVDGTQIWQLTSSATSITTRWIVLVVTAYRPDGTCVVLRASDESAGADETPPRSGLFATGASPLSIAQLTSLANAQGMSISK